MMNYNEYTHIPKEKFEFAQFGDRIMDKKLDTKPIGYFKDAWIRFKKNKASVAAAIILLCIVLFSLVVPLFNPYSVSYVDGRYQRCLPKSKLLESLGFWDGASEMKLNDKAFANYIGIGQGAADTDGTGVTYQEGLENKYSPVKSIGEEFKASSGQRYRYTRIDSYHGVGFIYLVVNEQEYRQIVEWQEANGLQIIYPMVETRDNHPNAKYNYDLSNANAWYKTDELGYPIDNNGNRIVNFETTPLASNYMYDDDGNLLYEVKMTGGQRKIRVLYYNYYIMKYDREPYNLFGTDGQGYDILARLANGIQTSLILAISIFTINFIIGAIYGSIEGYFGGWVDMIMERISDVLSGIPFVVVATLFQLHLVLTGKVSAIVGLLFAFVLTGWIGTAYRVRTQFYRFKGQEYVLAARTLGANDFRLMFKHIFPNTLGTIITASALAIPNVIFTESMLSFLGIVNLQGTSMTSLGTMLSNGRAYMSNFPHIILFPSIIISLLMISFNLFGNGLRDAFNPSLRGVEE